MSPTDDLAADHQLADLLRLAGAGEIDPYRDG